MPLDILIIMLYFGMFMYVVVVCAFQKWFIDDRDKDILLDVLKNHNLSHNIRFSLIYRLWDEDRVSCCSVCVCHSIMIHEPTIVVHIESELFFDRAAFSWRTVSSISSESSRRTKVQS